MMFTFKRDANGVETIHVGDVCVAKSDGPHPYDGSGGFDLIYGIGDHAIREAIERADAAGFWDEAMSLNPWANHCFRNAEVTVEVPSC